MFAGGCERKSGKIERGDLTAGRREDKEAEEETKVVMREKEKEKEDVGA